MISQRKGFTLVELVVIIVVIAILATIATLGLSQYQKQSRDAVRSADATSIAEALEKYYDTHGEYPSCADLTADPNIVTGANGALRGVDQSVLVSPTADSGVENSISCTELSWSSGSDTYAYVGDGSATCATTSCLQFKLQYRDEQSGTIKSIDSRRQQNIATSGGVALTSPSVTYTSVTLSWNAVPNATGYMIQRDTANTFNTGALTQQLVAAPAATYQFNDLGPNMTRYYRIKPVSASGDGAWSNVVTRTTTNFAAITLSHSQVNPSSITSSWTNLSGITSYTIQRSDTSGFVTGSGTTTTTGNFTSQSFTDTPVQVQRFYRVRANVTNGSGTTYSSNWTSVPYTTVVPAPSAPSISAAMSGTNAVGTSGSTSCTQGASVRYSIRETHKANSGLGDSWTAWSAWSTTAPTMTVAGLQGNRHAFQSKAACLYSGVYSTEAISTTATTVRGINQPAPPTWPAGLSKSWKNATSGNYMNYGTSCPDGTWVNFNEFHSYAWNGSTPRDFYHNFGFNDYWYLGPSGGANVEYWAYYNCISSYAAASATSGASYDVIWVYP